MQYVNKFTLTRMAPTPSGFLHLGNIYSFALTAAIAKLTGAKILLRIDDLDQERANPAYINDIFETLTFLHLPYNSGPRNAEELQSQFSQLHRLNNYNALLEQLKNENKVYACACSRTKVLQDSKNGVYPGTCKHKQLPPDTPDVTWRLKTGTETLMEVNTLKHGTITTKLPPVMSDFVVRKKDGMPSYQLASLADDLHFGVDLVVRGEDLWNSTLAQLYLAQTLGKNKFMQTVFHHHALLESESGNKLSKSAGDTSIQHLRKLGKTSSQIYNLMGRQAGVLSAVHHWQDLIDLV